MLFFFDESIDSYVFVVKYLVNILVLSFEYIRFLYVFIFFGNWC